MSASVPEPERKFSGRQFDQGESKRPIVVFATRRDTWGSIEPACPPLPSVDAPVSTPADCQRGLNRRR